MSILKYELNWLVAGMILGSTLLPGSVQAEVVGVWVTKDEKSHVRIEACGKTLCGIVVWLKEPNDENDAPKRDRNNADKSLRDRPIVGLDLLSGFRLDAAAANAWVDGEIYNPEDGKTYAAEIAQQGSDRLLVKGCVWLFCNEQTWRRVE